MSDNASFLDFSSVMLWRILTGIFAVIASIAVIWAFNASSLPAYSAPSPDHSSPESLAISYAENGQAAHELGLEWGMSNISMMKDMVEHQNEFFTEQGEIEEELDRTERRAHFIRDNRRELLSSPESPEVLSKVQRDDGRVDVTVSWTVNDIVEADDQDLQLEERSIEEELTLVEADGKWKVDGQLFHHTIGRTGFRL